jgi:hypothetical protein
MAAFEVTTEAPTQGLSAACGGLNSTSEVC